MDKDKRTTPRLPTDRLNLVGVTLDSGYSMLGALRNISLRGLLLEKLTDVAASLINVGDRLTVHDCPESLERFLLERTGQVAWARDRLCGVRLDEDTAGTNAELKDLLGREYLLPWPDSLGDG